MKLSKLIDDSFKDDDEKPRNYIGASSIGSDCLRQIWYQFKGVKAESVPPKMRKNWAIGKALEKTIVEWIKQAGFKVETGNLEFNHDGAPYFKGHFDGFLIYRKKKYILEVKTAKNASFGILKRKGLKEWQPIYYSQIQSYMGMSGILNAVILVLNKDTGDLHDELIEFDAEHYSDLVLKAKMIHSSPFEPPKINASPLYFKCKMCQYNKVCHK